MIKCIGKIKREKLFREYSMKSISRIRRKRSWRNIRRGWGLRESRLSSRSSKRHQSRSRWRSTKESNLSSHPSTSISNKKWMTLNSKKLFVKPHLSNSLRPLNTPHQRTLSKNSTLRCNHPNSSQCSTKRKRKRLLSRYSQKTMAPKTPFLWLISS